MAELKDTTINGDLTLRNGGGGVNNLNFFYGNLINSNDSYTVIRPICRMHYSNLGGSTDTSTYLQSLVKTICAKYPNDNQAMYIGLAHPNSVGMMFLTIYDNRAVSNGLPQYCSGVYFYLGGGIIYFGTSNHTWYFK